MKTKEIQELRTKGAGDLQEKLAELRATVMDLRFQQATGALEDSSKVASAKRDVARVLTLIGEQRRSAAGKDTAS